jgi:peptide/nickel transport system substrate-binding protein
MRRVAVSLLLTLALIASACAPGQRTPTPQPKGVGGVLIVGTFREPTTLNPDLIADDDAFSMAQSLYNKLVTLDADYRIIPDLARTWEIAADGLTYTFHLAKNVKWHDGKPCTATDVKWTLEQIKSSGGITAPDLAPVKSVETPNDSTVILRLSEPSAPLLSALAWYGTFILPKHLYEGSDWSKNPANERPVGTGPFSFKEWVKGQRIVLEANKSYFREGPWASGVEIRVFADSTAVREALARGEVQFTQRTLPAADVAALSQTSGVKTGSSPTPSRYYLAFNLRRKPFDDLRVRRAINLALDRAEIVNKGMGGYGSPGFGFYTPAVAWAYNGSAQAPAFDVAGANKLLDEAGLARGANGLRLKANLVSSNTVSFVNIARVVQSQLFTVGISLTLESLDTTAWNTRLFKENSFDIALQNGTQGPDPNNMRLRFGSKGTIQGMGYNSAEVDALLDEGARASTLQARAAAYQKAQEILARDLPIAPLSESVKVEAYREGVTGLSSFEARGLVTFQDYSLVKTR